MRVEAAREAAAGECAAAAAAWAWPRGEWRGDTPILRCNPPVPAPFMGVSAASAPRSKLSRRPPEGVPSSDMLASPSSALWWLKSKCWLRRERVEEPPPVSPAERFAAASFARVLERPPLVALSSTPPAPLVRALDRVPRAELVDVLRPPAPPPAPPSTLLPRAARLGVKARLGSGAVPTPPMECEVDE